jgi:hypothetical protein
VKTMGEKLLAMLVAPWPSSRVLKLRR